MKRSTTRRGPGRVHKPKLARKGKTIRLIPNYQPSTREEANDRFVTAWCFAGTRPVPVAVLGEYS